MEGIDEPLLIDPLPLSNLSALLSSTTDPPQLFAKGTVAAWDNTTRRSSVTISGTAFADLSALDTAGLATLAVGDTVLILKLNRSWLIVGRILDPL
jgi:hypothetical protein